MIKGSFIINHSYQNNLINKFLVQSSQPPFGETTTPPAGFPAHYSGPNYDKSWFNSSTIIYRYNICKNVFFKGKYGFNPAAFIQSVVTDPTDPELILTTFTDMMFPESASDERKQYFIDTFLFDGGSLLQEGDSKYYYWESLWADYLQGEKVNTVNYILKSLIEALIWSQEFQTT